MIDRWLRSAPDTDHGGFYVNLDRQWRPVPPTEKTPLLISRHVYGFSTAYMLTGDQRYLQVARRGADYLFEHAWDTKNGGWYDLLDQDGRPLKRTKTVSHQLYTNVGLTAYYLATGDSRAIERVRSSAEIQRKRALDPTYGGYAQVLNEDLSVLDFGKNKHAHYGYAGSLLLNLYLATGDRGVRNWSEQLMDISLDRMRDRGGWFYGFRSTFDRQWRRTPFVKDGREWAATGAQLTAALALARLYEQTGQARFRDAVLELSKSLTADAWNEKTGAWRDSIDVQNPSRVAPSATVSWWVQIYGSMLEMHLYHLTGDRVHLDRFAKSEAFFRQHFQDPKYGGAYTEVNAEGKPSGDLHKASSSGWHASYHEMEHAAMNYIHLNLYVHRTSPKLYLKFSDATPRRVCQVDDPRFVITGVEQDGRPVRYAASDGCTLSIPSARGQTFAVTYGPKKPRG
ncbi:MAG: AGE family epimerase/isomerase [Bryobacteraceae bacterium]